MKKIMFNDRYGLTQAVLEGKKTMTRRIVPQKYFDIYNDMCRLGTPCLPLNDWIIQRVSKYKVGEVVAVVQSYSDAGIDPHFLLLSPIKGSVYHTEMEIEAMSTPGWNNKMFVRADLMPHQIKITDVKVERLQDISDEDCLKEGIEFAVHFGSYFCRGMRNKEEIVLRYATARAAFAALIDKVSGIGTWEKNPYVFAYQFELVK